ncbi:HNH endonuclease signature motif containing protein [Vibrio fluvialis]
MTRKYKEERTSIPAAIEREVKTMSSHCCAMPHCSIDDYLEIHHIDQNRENNRVENLILLCDRHHKMAHDNKIDRKALRIYWGMLRNKANSFNPADECHRVLNFIDWMKNIVCEVEYDDEGNGSRWLNGSMLEYFEYHIYDAIENLDYQHYNTRLRSFDPVAREVQDEMIQIVEELKEFVDQNHYISLHRCFKLAPDVGYECYSRQLVSKLNRGERLIRNLGDNFVFLNEYCERR